MSDKGKKGRRLSGVIKQDAANSGVANLIGELYDDKVCELFTTLSYC